MTESGSPKAAHRINHTGHLELHRHGTDEHRNGRATRLDDEVRCLKIERIAYEEQVAKCFERITNLKKRPMRVVAKSSEEFFGLGAQIDHRRLVTKHTPIAFPEDGPSARGDNRVAFGK